jgi:signal transduction histidine kinase
MPALQTPKPGPIIRTTIDGVSQTRRHASSLRTPTPGASRAAAPRGLPQPETHRTSDESLAATAAMLQERARIARELHDSVSQTLYAITLAASRARGLLRQTQHGGVEVQPIVEEVLELATAGQSELRALLTNIRSDQLTSGGLIEGLGCLAANVQARYHIPVRVQRDREVRVPAAVKEALLLITREALHNIVKHAGATTVDIAFEVDAQRLVLHVTDDGRGFDPSASRPGHFGLQSMRERAAAIGATLEMDSIIGAGAHVRVSVSRTIRK